MIDLPPMKYSYKTRIGNWSEEWELDETKLKDFKYSQEGGNIMELDSEKKKALTTRRAAMSYLPGGEMLDGAKVMLQNTLVGGVLACNVWDRVSNVQDSYGVTCSLNQSSLTRTVFKIKKTSDSRRGASDKTIRYGDRIQIMANDRIFGTSRMVTLLILLLFYHFSTYLTFHLDVSDESIYYYSKFRQSNSLPRSYNH